MTQNKISYPLLWVNTKEYSLGVYRNEEELTKCTKGVLKSSFFYDLYLIDYSGNKFKIEHIEKVQTINRFSLPTLFWKIWGGELVKAKIILNERTEVANIDLLKKDIFLIFDSNIDMWDADGQLDKVKSMLNKISSVKNLMDIMKKKYFNEPLI